MAVTVKTKPAKKVSTKTTPEGQMAQLVDEIGDIEKQIAAMMVDLEPLTKQHAKKKAELLEWVNKTHVPSDKTSVEGKEYEAEVSAKGNKTTITDIEKLFKLFKKIEAGLVFELMKFNIGDIRKYLTPKQIEQVTKTERVNERTVKISKLL